MSALTSAALPALGHVVAGKYVLQEIIGQGGMGAVFSAENANTGGKVAIKVMLADPSNQEAIQRFRREAHAAARLESEHIVKVIDVAEEQGYAYMVLEYLRGEDLQKILERDGRLPLHVAVQYVTQALLGLGHAHQQGIVHRDLKPSNLFKVQRGDGTSIIKVLDFGISKSNASVLNEKPEALTSTKAMLGSPLYMSPEQLRSSKTVDYRADLWGIGVILYELLTATLPFHGETLGELFAEILDARPTPPSVRAPHLPPQIDAIILRCLRANRDERFSTAAELAQALAPFATPGAPSVLASTAFMPSSMQGPPGSRQSGVGPHPGMGMGMGMGMSTGANTGIPAMTPPGGGPPPYAAPLPVGAAVTGSGVHPPVVKGTVPLGSTPHPPWGNTTGGAVTVPKTGGAAVGALIGVFAVLAIAGTGLIVWKKKTSVEAAPTSVSAKPPPPESSAGAAVPPSTPASVASVASAAPTQNPSATTTTTTPATTGGIAQAPRPGGGGLRPKPPEPLAVKTADPPPPKPADPPPPVTKPATANPPPPKPPDPSQPPGAATSRN